MLPTSLDLRKIPSSAAQTARRASVAVGQHVARGMTQVELLQERGYRRVGSPKSGFRFVGAPAREVPRLRALRLPPAWTEVAINPSPNARLQAVGKDRRGRWQ